MLDFILEMLKTPAGSFASVLGAILLLFFLAYKGGKIVEKYTVVDKILESIDKIKEDIFEIKAYISIAKQNNNNLLAKSQSPISLTKKGEEAFIDLHIERIVEKSWNELNKTIKSKLKEDYNPYNIQEVCFEIGKTYSKITSKNDYDAIKTYAFQKEYNLFDFDLLFGIVIRDTFLREERINVKVDTHDSNKN